MVVIDSTVLMLLIDPKANPPTDESTGKPVDRCMDRIKQLLQTLSETKTRVLIPAPVLSEILVGSGSDKSAILKEFESTYSFKIEPFDTRAAVEVAYLTDTDLASGRRLEAGETRAKVKYDRQIIAIAKVNNATVIYSDDIKLGKTARASGITVIKTSDLPLPPPRDGDLFPEVQRF